MPVTADESNFLSKLRSRAETQLQTGTSRKTGQWSLGIDALRMLHRLSSNPDSATDALKLLHELQVHQVELDLQNEEITANEQALVEDLNLYRELYDFAPLGYFVVDLQGRVVQGNFAAAELFGVAPDELEGQPLDTALSDESRPRLLKLLHNVSETGAKESCLAEMGWGSKGSREVMFLASKSVANEHILLACVEC